MEQKIIIVTAPSGSGKTTIVRQVLAQLPALQFSVSATTRNPRQGEVDGVDYYFLSPELFREKIAQDAFAEYEMVYQDKYYGTLHEKLEETWQAGKTPLVDIDVKGAKTLKTFFGERALSLFIQAPSIEILKERLINRGTESPEMLKERLDKAELETSFKSDFDQVIVNDQLEVAVTETLAVVRQFLND